MSNRTYRRRVHFARQIVVRVDEELYQALEADAEANGRTIAQTVRHKLRELR